VRDNALPVLVGAAISPYQHFGLCECDMPDEPGARHLAFYEQDLSLAGQIGLDVFRTGIEWALVEPEEGRYSHEWLELFRQYLSAVRERGMQAWVTLHHFTNPRWVWRHGGWLSGHVARKFAAYAELVARELGDLIDVAIIFNEPNVYPHLAYTRGVLPPHAFMAERLAAAAMENIITAIAMARDALKSYGVRCTFTYSYTLVEGRDPVSVSLRLAAWLQDGVFRQLFREMDLTAVNFYVVSYFDGYGIRHKLKPRALLAARRWAPGPLAVTEFGIPTRDETLRFRYLCTMARVLAELGPVAAVWWSFLHGYEWGLGYRPFFALVDVDRETWERRLTPLALRFRETLLSPPAECGEINEIDMGYEWRWAPPD
jgi:beta-glucosidase